MKGKRGGLMRAGRRMCGMKLEVCWASMGSFKAKCSKSALNSAVTDDMASRLSKPCEKKKALKTNTRNS